MHSASLSLKNYLLPMLLLCILLFVTEGCKPDAPTYSGGNVITNTPHIHDTCFTNTIIIDGHGCDNLLIENTCFSTPNDGAKHYGLVLQNVENVTIRNCTFKNISNIAILVGNQGKICKNVVIENNEFSDIGGDAINAYNDAARGGTIRNNHIHHIGKDTLTYTGIEGAFHGIYWKDKDVLIEDNHIHHNYDKGSAITVRSGATIRRNKIHHTKFGINYTANYNANGSGLIIENNLLYENSESGITLSGSNNSLNDIQFANIRFNTVVGKNQVGIQLAYLKSVGGGSPNENFKVYGNLIVNENTTGLLLNPATVNPTIFANFTSHTLADAQLVSPLSEDYHTHNTSPVVNAGGVNSDFPTDDLDKNP